MRRSWERFIPEADLAVHAAAGYGKRLGLGRRPATLVIDVNYRFLGRRPLPILESVRRWPKSSGERGWAALPRIARLLALSRQAGIPVFYTTGLGARDSLQARKSRQEGTESRGVDDLDIVAEVAPAPDEAVVAKPGPSPFFGTPLPAYLVQRGVDTLLVAGGTTSGCVRGTTVDAATRGYRVGVVEECVFDRFEVSHAVALFDLNAKYADVVSLEEVERYLAALASPGEAATVGGEPWDVR
jgi:nicotinamidase-related amidase